MRRSGKDLDEAEAKRVVVTGWKSGQDHDDLMSGFTSVVETPEEVTIDAARMGIKLLVSLIEETKEGKRPTVSLKEIGEAMLKRNPNDR